MRKRLAIWLAGLAMVALPMTAMAMTSVSDSDLAGVTGQAGVSINVDVTAQISIGTMAWGDLNGVATGSTTGAAGGFVGLNGLNFELQMHPRTDIAIEKEKFIDIDVIGAVAGGVSLNAAGGTVAFVGPGVRIGLPTAEIIVSALDTSAFVSPGILGTDGVYRPDLANGGKLGNIYVGGMTMRLGVRTASTIASGGYVIDTGSIVIAAASAAGGATGTSDGVRMLIAPKIDSITFGAISWGNEGLVGVYGDQLTGIVNDITGQAPGFIGLRDLRLAGLTVLGVMDISVGQSALVNYAAGNLYRDAFGSTALVQAVKKPMVQIALEDGFRMGFTEISGNVTMSINKNLVGGAYDTADMGSFFIGGLSVVMKDNAARTQTLFAGTHDGSNTGATNTTYVIPAHPSVVQIMAH